MPVRGSHAGAYGRGPGPLGVASRRGKAEGSGAPEAPDTWPRDIACPRAGAGLLILSLPSPADVTPIIMFWAFDPTLNDNGIRVK